MTHEYDEMIDAAADKLFDDVLSAPEYFIENLARDAARLAELGTDADERGKYATLITEEIHIDATDYIQNAVVEYEDGTAIHADPAGPGLVRVNVKSPTVYVVDGNGTRIEGGRIMVEYYDVELDTP